MGNICVLLYGRFKVGSLSGLHLARFPTLIVKLVLGILSDEKEDHHTTLISVNNLFSLPPMGPDDDDSDKEKVPKEVEEDWRAVRDVVEGYGLEGKIDFLTPQWYFFMLGVLNANSFGIKPWARGDIVNQEEYVEDEVVVTSSSPSGEMEMVDNKGVIQDGSALFSLPSFLNHSCSPNCSVDFIDGPNFR